MKVPEPTLRRLPWHLSNVKLLKQKGNDSVSSTQISKEINIDVTNCQRPSYVNISGRTRVGYEVDTLIAVLEGLPGIYQYTKPFTRCRKSWRCLAARLGSELHFGLEIVVCISMKPELVGRIH